MGKFNSIQGFIDYDESKLKKINRIISLIRQKSKLLNIKEIDTPIVERTDFLLDKYGEEAEKKLIFKLEEKKYSLRYDLTVPFSRYIMNNKIEKMKKLQIGRVFRKDIPYPESGRFCEFYQADIDIIGDYGEMMPEVEIIKLITMVLEELKIKNYSIKINFRENLEKIVELAQIPKNKFKEVCISIDKLDKKSWDYVEDELKGKDITTEQLRRLKEKLDLNYFDPNVMQKVEKLNQYLDVFQCNKNIIFDAKLARGLDYYTGIIFEVITPDNSKIGTIIAGGRYDKLIHKNNKNIPAVGVSFGINRIEMCIENNQENEMKILVVSEKKYLMEKLRIVNLLRENNYITDYFYEEKKVINQINYGIKNNFRYIVIYGENAEGLVKVKKNDQSKDVICCIDDIASYIKFNEI